eukprot:gene15621-15766_t
MYRLDGRIIVVTGAARGIGATIAHHIATLGAYVVLTDRSPAGAATANSLVEAGLSAEYIEMDVTSSEDVNRVSVDLLGRHGRIDGLVANAGIAYESSTVDHTDADWRRVMSVNLDGTFFCLRAFGRLMVNAGRGAMVATSSIAGVKAVRPEVHVGYDVSKAGVAHMCRVLGVEWAKSGVRVNAVGPGYTDTEMLAEVGRTQPEVMKRWLDDMPIGRLLDRTEIASAIAFLLSDASRGITGQLLMVDGGYSAA